MADEEKGAKWWIRYAIVPLLAGGGGVILALASFVYMRLHSPDPGSKNSVPKSDIAPPPKPDESRYRLLSPAKPAHPKSNSIDSSLHLTEPARIGPAVDVIIWHPRDLSSQALLIDDKKPQDGVIVDGGADSPSTTLKLMPGQHTISANLGGKRAPRLLWFLRVNVLCFVAKISLRESSMRSRSGSAAWLTVIFVIIFFVFMHAGLCQTTKSRQSPTPHNVYIARFTSSDLIDPKLLASFRDLFEESFEQLLAGDGGVYTVLNRETIDKVLGQAQDEAKLTSVEQLDATLKGRLKIENAQGFVFGKISDDKESGEIIISVKLQSFDSILHWNKSVGMRKGLLYNFADRKKAMEQLVSSIDGTSHAEEKEWSPRSSSPIQPSATKPSSQPRQISTPSSINMCIVFQGIHACNLLHRQGNLMVGKWPNGDVSHMEIEHFSTTDITLNDSVVLAVNNQTVQIVYKAAVQGNQMVNGTQLFANNPIGTWTADWVQ